MPRYCFIEIKEWKTLVQPSDRIMIHRGDMSRHQKDSSLACVEAALLFPCLSQRSNEGQGGCVLLHVAARVCFLAISQAVCSKVFAFPVTPIRIKCVYGREIIIYVRMELALCTGTCIIHILSFICCY